VSIDQQSVQGVEVLDLVYGGSAQTPLVAKAYVPAGDISAAVVDVHGGAWYRGDYLHGQHYGQVLAGNGILVLALEFRDAARGGVHPQATRDITAGGRYLRHHASAFGIDGTAITLLGSSSGGHLAMHAAVLPDVDSHRGTAINTCAPNEASTPAYSDVLDISAAVNGVVALWPVSDPLYRYEYAQRTHRDELCAGHEQYFGSKAVMAEASVPRIVAAGEALAMQPKQALPPLLVVQPGNDKNVPREMTQHLIDAWEGEGGLATCAFYPGMPHGFACQPGGHTARALHDVSAFVLACASYA